MENSKSQPQSDSVRLKTILELLHLSGNKLGKILGYKSAASVYHVLEGINNLSTGMIERIIKNFPQVNYLYLKTGKGQPILNDAAQRQAQQNLFGSIVRSDESIINKVINGESLGSNNPNDPLAYNVASQLQQIIDNGNTLNATMEKLIQNQLKILDTLQTKD
jgi:hypothetical protein